MKSISHKFQVFNKSDIEKALIKASWNDEFTPPKQKHFKKCLEIFQSKCSIDNYAILMSFIKQISFKKWVYSAKILAIIQGCISNAETVDLCDYIHHDESELKKLRQDLLKNIVKPPPHQEQFQYLISQLLFYYFKYIMKYARHAKFFIDKQSKITNDLNTMEQQLEKMEIHLKVSEIIFYIFEKILQHLLQPKYADKYQFVKTISIALFQDLTKLYIKCKQFCSEQLPQIYSYNNQSQIILRLYSFYCEFIKLTKNIQKIDYMIHLCKPFIPSVLSIDYFVVNIENNRSIEIFVNQYKKQYKNKDQSENLNDFQNNPLNKETDFQYNSNRTEGKIEPNKSNEKINNNSILNTTCSLKQANTQYNNLFNNNPVNINQDKQQSNEIGISGRKQSLSSVLAQQSNAILEDEKVTDLQYFKKQKEKLFTESKNKSKSNKKNNLSRHEFVKQRNTNENQNEKSSYSCSSFWNEKLIENKKQNNLHTNIFMQQNKLNLDFEDGVKDLSNYQLETSPESIRNINKLSQFHHNNKITPSYQTINHQYSANCPQDNDDYNCQQSNCVKESQNINLNNQLNRNDHLKDENFNNVASKVLNTPNNEMETENKLSMLLSERTPKKYDEKNQFQAHNNFLKLGKKLDFQDMFSNQIYSQSVKSSNHTQKLSFNSQFRKKKSKCLNSPTQINVNDFYQSEDEDNVQENTNKKINNNQNNLKDILNIDQDKQLSNKKQNNTDLNIFKQNTSQNLRSLLDCPEIFSKGDEQQMQINRQVSNINDNSIQKIEIQQPELFDDFHINCTEINNLMQEENEKNEEVLNNQTKEKINQIFTPVKSKIRKQAQVNNMTNSEEYKYPTDLINYYNEDSNQDKFENNQHTLKKISFIDITNQNQEGHHENSPKLKYINSQSTTQSAMNNKNNANQQNYEQQNNKIQKASFNKDITDIQNRQQNSNINKLNQNKLSSRERNIKQDDQIRKRFSAHQTHNIRDKSYSDIVQIDTQNKSDNNQNQQNHLHQNTQSTLIQEQLYQIQNKYDIVQNMTSNNSNLIQNNINHKQNTQQDKQIIQQDIQNSNKNILKEQNKCLSISPEKQSLQDQAFQDSENSMKNIQAGYKLQRKSLRRFSNRNSSQTNFSNIPSLKNIQDQPNLKNGLIQTTKNQEQEQIILNSLGKQRKSSLVSLKHGGFELNQPKSTKAQQRTLMSNIYLPQSISLNREETSNVRQKSSLIQRINNSQSLQQQDQQKTSIILEDIPYKNDKNIIQKLKTQTSEEINGNLNKVFDYEQSTNPSTNALINSISTSIKPTNSEYIQGDNQQSQRNIQRRISFRKNENSSMISSLFNSQKDINNLKLGLKSPQFSYLDYQNFTNLQEISTHSANVKHSSSFLSNNQTNFKHENGNYLQKIPTQQYTPQLKISTSEQIYIPDSTKAYDIFKETGPKTCINKNAIFFNSNNINNNWSTKNSLGNSFSAFKRKTTQSAKGERLNTENLTHQPYQNIEEDY